MSAIGVRADIFGAKADMPHRPVMILNGCFGGTPVAESLMIPWNDSVSHFIVSP